MAEDVEWNTDQLKAFAKSLGSDKDGRALKKQLSDQFDSITENLRDRLYNGVSNLPGAGTYPADLAESVKFTTKLIGGKNARVTIVGEGKTKKGKWREIGHLLDDGYFYHPAWGYWRGQPGYLREAFPVGPSMVTDAVGQATPAIADDIRSVLTDYLDKLTDIRSALA